MLRTCLVLTVNILFEIALASSFPATAAIKPIAVEELTVPMTIPFPQQLQRHVAVLQRLNEALIEIDKQKKSAEQADSLKEYKAAEQDLENVKKALAPYAIAEAKTGELIKQGYLLNAIGPQVCKPAGECTAIDAITALFFFVGDNKVALGPDLKNKGGDKETKTKVEVNGFDVIAFIEFLSGKPLDLATFGLLPSIRDAIIPTTNTGEIAKWIRDPGKRTVEIVQDARDKIIPKTDNGEGAKIIRDPIKCTVGHLFKMCP